MIYGMSPLEVLAVYLMAMLALALVIFLAALAVKKCWAIRARTLSEILGRLRRAVVFLPGDCMAGWKCWAIGRVTARG